MDDLMTAKQVAALLNVRPQAIYQWAKNGTIPSIRISEKCLRFDKQKITQWLAEHRNVGEVR